MVREYKEKDRVYEDKKYQDRSHIGDFTKNTSSILSLEQIRLSREALQEDELEIRLRKQRLDGGENIDEIR